MVVTTPYLPFFSFFHFGFYAFIHTLVFLVFTLLSYPGYISAVFRSDLLSYPGYISAVFRSDLLSYPGYISAVFNCIDNFFVLKTYSYCKPPVKDPCAGGQWGQLRAVAPLALVKLSTFLRSTIFCPFSWHFAPVALF